MPTLGDHIVFPDGSVQSIAGGGGGGGTSIDVVPAISRPQGLFQRRYTFDSDVQGFTTTAGTLTWVSGKAQIAGAASDTIVLEPSSAANVADGEVYVDILPTVTGSNGNSTVDVIFRATDSNNYYMFNYNQGNSAGAEEFFLYKKVAGAYSVIGYRSMAPSGTTTTPPVLSPLTGPHRVMIRFVGSQIFCFINEVFVGAWTDTTFTTGRVGIYTSLSSTLQFDNVSVYSLPSTWAPKNYDDQSSAPAQAAQVPVIARPQGTLQRRYTFDSDVQSWTIAGGGSLAFASGKLQITGAGNAVVFAEEPTSAASVADGEVYIDITPVTFDSNGLMDAGVAFRVQDSNNYYHANVRRGTGNTAQISLSKVVSGSDTALISSATQTGGTTPLLLGSAKGVMRLMVRFVGSHIWLFWNEVLVGTVDDTTYTTGKLGVVLWSTTTAAVILVDNATVYALPSNWSPANYDQPAISGLQAWQPATLQNSWINYTTGFGHSPDFADAAYYLGPDGVVRLRGTIQGGAADSVFMTLPAGYRPEKVQEFAVWDNQHQTATRATVFPDGTIQCHVAISAAGTDFIDLGGISFRQYA